MKNTVELDFFGDVHGELDSLIALLEKMGYTNSCGAYCHPERKAVFVGDLIDRGSDQVGVYRLVRAMVEAGQASMVLGNHEINAIGWLTADPNSPGKYCRRRSEKYAVQHQSFLDQVVEDSPLHHEIIEWFKTRPLFINEPDYRVVHACWSKDAVMALRPILDKNNVVKPQYYPDLLSKYGILRESMELLIKGASVKLPDGIHYYCQENLKRSKTRIQWWNDYADTILIKDVAISLPASAEDAIGLKPIQLDKADLIGYPSDGKPLFIGHYWMNGPTVPLRDNVCCVDYSVATDRPNARLAAYRFSGEQILSEENFVSVERVRKEPKVESSSAYSSDW